jgi:hypothetical protein
LYRERLSSLFAVAALLAGVAAPTAKALPPIKHVFVIVLENKNFDETFGTASKAPYLAKDLVGQGEMLSQYYGIGHLSLDNYIALVSGQSPNPLTQSDCQAYQDMLPGTIGADGQAMGLGCVYPSAVKTVANQLEDKGLTWGGYMEDMANNPTQAPTCRHPDLGTQDTTQSPKTGDQYAARHNPFVYFHSIIDTPSCAANDVPLDRLPAALETTAATPNLVFITPNLCNDGHDTPCVDGKPGGLVSPNAFLQTWVPRIIGSPAYKQDGLLIITFDESGSGAEACCTTSAPNTPNQGGTSAGSGGGRVGAVLLSPWVTPNTKSSTKFNHYSLLRSIEDVFALPHLGYAGVPTTPAFGDDLFTGAGPGKVTPPACTSSTLPAKKGTLPRGTLIASAKVSGGKLKLRLTHGADLSLRAGAKRFGPRRGKACATLSVAIPKGAHTVTVKATVHGARETRTLHA